MNTARVRDALAVARRHLRHVPPARLALHAVALALLGLLTCGGTYDHLRAASLLARASGQTGLLAKLYDTPVVEENLLLHTEYGPFRARVYRPRDGRPRRGLVLAHGVHYMGIDEPRLRPFARNLARAGLAVLTPELGALADYRVHASSVSEIRAAARYLAGQGYVEPGGVGVLGLSFAGGLSLLAASDPSMAGTVSLVFALGGHNDLYRVSRFLATDVLDTPQGPVHMRAHDYGLIVFFYAHAERFVQGEQLLLFRDALRQLLHEGRPEAERAAANLSGDARRLFDLIDRNDKPALAPLVSREIPALRAEMDSLSPAGHLGALRGTRVVLMHGAHDDVMPPSEPLANARELAGRAPVHLLVSPVVKHVTVEGDPTLWQTWQLVDTMAELFASGPHPPG